MTSVEKKTKFLHEMRDYDYRHEYVSANIVNSLAFQIGLMRDTRGWTHDELAQQCGKTPKTISSLEDPNDKGYTLGTLRQLAKVFDVALLIRFAPFGELADWVINLNEEKLTPLPYEQEQLKLFSQVESGIEYEVRRQYDAGLGATLDVHSASEENLSFPPEKSRRGDNVARIFHKFDSNIPFSNAEAA